MTREPDPTGFDAIVATWRAEGNVPQWPDDPQLDEMAADAGTGVDTDVDTDAPADPAAAERTDEPPGSRPETAGPDAPGPPFGAARADPDHADPPFGTARADPDHADSPFGTARTDPSRAGHPLGTGRPGDPTDVRPAASRADPGRVDDRADDRADHNADDNADDDLDRRDAGRPDDADPDHPGAGSAPRGGTDPHAEDVADRRGTNGEHGHPVRAGAAADPHADEHFVPPEPPPLPRLGPPILVGLTLIGLGLVLVTFPGWVGVPQVYGLPLGLVAIAAGLGWLVLRLWPDPDDVPPPLYLDDPDDPDGGAVL